MPPTLSSTGALLADFTDLTDRIIQITFQLGPKDPSWPKIAAGDHEAYMRYALSLARLSTPHPPDFSVGALLVDSKTGEIVSTGYTLELEGNTHAEQIAIEKFLTFHKVDGTSGTRLTKFEEDLSMRWCSIDLYMTTERCSERDGLHESCVSRSLKIRLVNIYVGVKEPKIFVSGNDGSQQGRRRIIHVPGMEEEILAAAKAGHPEEDRELVLQRTKGENEYLERVNERLEEENEEMREETENHCAWWREGDEFREMLNDSDGNDEEDGNYVDFVQEPLEDIEALREIIKRLKEENEKLRQKLGRSAEEKRRDEVERANEENERLKVVNWELGRQNEWLRKRFHRIEERYNFDD